MIFRRLFHIFPLVAVMAACDTVDESDRYIEVEPVEAQRKVLLEEFTGQNCLNCPDAHKIIEKLEEQYGEDLIVVSIHAGPFGIPTPAGLMQKEGDEYAKRWGISSYPAGIVDRNPEVLAMDAWAAAIRNAIEIPSTYEIELEATVSEDKSTIDISTTILTSSASSGDCLQLWVTEDSIVGYQRDGNQRVPDYIHNNVFRATVNSEWGEQINLTPNVYYTAENFVEIDSEWNLDNVNIVGFVYNQSGVLQCAKISLRNSGEQGDTE